MLVVHRPIGNPEDLLGVGERELGRAISSQVETEDDYLQSLFQM